MESMLWIGAQRFPVAIQPCNKLVSLCLALIRSQAVGLIQGRNMLLGLVLTLPRLLGVLRFAMRRLRNHLQLEGGRQLFLRAGERQVEVEGQRQHLQLQQLLHLGRESTQLSL
jgi:hypothetical protein